MNDTLFVIWRPAGMLIDSSEFINFMIGIFIEEPNEVKNY